MLKWFCDKSTSHKKKKKKGGGRLEEGTDAELVICTSDGVVCAP